jgi:hypothetical protein
MTTAPTAPTAAAPRGREPRRAALVVLAIVVVAGLVVDANIERAAPPQPLSVDAGDPSVAAPLDAVSSTWYCAGASAAPEGASDGHLILVNPHRDDVTGRVTIYPINEEPRQIPVTVPASSRFVLRYQDVVQAPFVAALVQLDGGGVGAEHSVSGPHGFGVGPCATAASSTWYFAEGSTLRDDLMLLTLFNPFPDDAIVDLSFTTDQGRAEPGDFQGIVIPGRGMRLVNVADHLRRREAVAVTVAARRGRLVADRIQARGANGRKGLTISLGATAPHTEWLFPDGVVADGVVERFHVYNPTRDEAVVDVELNADEGAVEPFQLRVPPRQRVTLNLAEESRVPRNVGYSVAVRSLNEVPVVVERTADAAAPSPRSGIADTMGVRTTARNWLLADGAATEVVDEWVTVLNPTAEQVTVSLHALIGGRRVDVEGVQDVAVEPGRRRSFRLTDHIAGRADLALLVAATGPVAVERGIYFVGHHGLSRSMGIPLRDEPER